MSSAVCFPRHVVKEVKKTRTSQYYYHLMSSYRLFPVSSRAVFYLTFAVYFRTGRAGAELQLHAARVVLNGGGHAPAG